jgi:hypothetical protein
MKILQSRVLLSKVSEFFHEPEGKNTSSVLTDSLKESLKTWLLTAFSKASDASKMQKTN